ncbi:hypothetical protein C8R43DRAFT_950845 [Mycena crocata]|nr:hypothetical protein C8R43DRAFT_950845 [Mycena crocata]
MTVSRPQMEGLILVRSLQFAPDSRTTNESSCSGITDDHLIALWLLLQPGILWALPLAFLEGLTLAFEEEEDSDDSGRPSLRSLTPDASDAENDILLELRLPKIANMPVGAGNSRDWPLPIDERGRVVKPGKGIENPFELDALGNLVQPGKLWQFVGEGRNGRAGSTQAISTSTAPRIYMARRSTGGKRRREHADGDGDAPAAVLPHAPTPNLRPNIPPRVEAAVPRPVQQSLVRVAARYRIHPPFSEDGLWLSAARPRDVETVKPHHICSICWGVKCHPVTSHCGHSHCFVCIRLWLQKSWHCPDCKKKMFYRPMRQWAEEHELESSYPGWTDETAVSYSWAGLKFAVDTLYPYYG